MPPPADVTRCGARGSRPVQCLEPSLRRVPARGTFGPIVVSAAYYLGAQIGFALQSPNAPQSVLWLPNSILLAVLLIVPFRRWPAYLAAAFPAQMLVAVGAGAPPLTMALLFLTNCADAALGAFLVRRVTRSSRAIRVRRTGGNGDLRRVRRHASDRPALLRGRGHLRRHGVERQLLRRVRHARAIQRADAPDRRAGHRRPGGARLAAHSRAARGRRGRVDRAAARHLRRRVLAIGGIPGVCRRVVYAAAAAPVGGVQVRTGRYRLGRAARLDGRELECAPRSRPLLIPFAARGGCVPAAVPAGEHAPAAVPVGRDPGTGPRIARRAGERIGAPRQLRSRSRAGRQIDRRAGDGALPHRARHA